MCRSGMKFQSIWMPSNQGEKLSGGGGNVRGQHSANPAGKSQPLVSQDLGNDGIYSILPSPQDFPCNDTFLPGTSQCQISGLCFSARRWEWICEGGDLILWK